MPFEGVVEVTYQCATWLAVAAILGFVAGAALLAICLCCCCYAPFRVCEYFVGRYQSAREKFARRFSVHEPNVAADPPASQGVPPSRDVSPPDVAPTTTVNVVNRLPSRDVSPPDVAPTTSINVVNRDIDVALAQQSGDQMKRSPYRDVDVALAQRSGDNRIPFPSVIPDPTSRRTIGTGLTLGDERDGGPVLVMGRGRVDVSRMTDILASLGIARVQALPLASNAALSEHHSCRLAVVLVPDGERVVMKDMEHGSGEAKLVNKAHEWAQGFVLLVITQVYAHPSAYDGLYPVDDEKFQRREYAPYQSANRFMVISGLSGAGRRDEVLNDAQKSAFVSAVEGAGP